MPKTRRILLLQGPSSLFFSYLGDALAERGAEVLRIHLAPGDALFWRRPRGRHYRGDAAGWPGYLRDVISREGVTDLALLGNRRERHRQAIDVAHEAGVQVHHIELGYVRPDWLTVEPDGAGPDGRFPRDWPTLEALARGPEPAEVAVYRAPFWRNAAMDVGWNMSNVLASWATHPHFRHHAIWHPLAEYGGFLLRQAQLRRRRSHAARVWNAWSGAAGPLFLLPLQLRTDFQIRAHGPDPDLRVTVRRTVGSFALHAPADARLIVKEHPVDNALTPWRRIVRQAAGRAADRVEVVDGGDLREMLGLAAGVVTVNSTVGISALRRGVPVKTLGRTLYDLPGLVDPQPLDGFWKAPVPPDPRKVSIFLRALRHGVLVRGNFDGTGARPGAENVADRILEGPRF